MLRVLTLFIIPFGGGIPAGVLLARTYALAWPVTAGLYFVSDVLLALAFEPMMRLVIRAGRNIEFVARVAEAFRVAMSRTTAHYGGAGPVALLIIAFGVDPMTGRAATAAAGHGFISGWAIAIAGDMLYFGVVMAATLRLDTVLGDPDRTMWVILAAMFFLPVLVRRVRAAFVKAKSDHFCQSTP